MSLETSIWEYVAIASERYDRESVAGQETERTRIRGLEIVMFNEFWQIVAKSELRMCVARLLIG
jgi:hypothetical protein